HRAGQRERVRRDDANITLEVHERAFVEVLGVDDGGIDVREDLEFVGATHVVAVAAGAVADDAPAIGRADLARFKGFDHAGAGLTADAGVAVGARGAHGAEGDEVGALLLSSARPSGRPARGRSLTPPSGPPRARAPAGNWRGPRYRYPPAPARRSA